MGTMYISLSAVLSITGIILLIVLIILGIRLIELVNNINLLVKDVESKSRSLNNVFDIIDGVGDKFSFVINSAVEAISGFVSRKFKNKEEDENDEKKR